MQWQYRTLLFEFQKDGLLGDKYIDDEEVEELLNEQGARGWELVNVALIQEGLLAFFKRTLPHGVHRDQTLAGKESASVFGETPGAKKIQHLEPERIRDVDNQRRDTVAGIERNPVGNIKIS